MTNRKFLSLLLALFMVLVTVTPLFAENDSVTVLPPRKADEAKEPDNIVVIEDDKERFPIIDESEEGGKKIEETPEEPEIKEDNSPIILENREENNNIVILPPIRNEENKEEEETEETSKEPGEPEEPKDEKENKKEVKVQILSKRDVKKPASEGAVNLVLLNDNPADVNEEVYDEKIRWKESDFNMKEDKIISLSDEGLLKAKINKKLVIPEMENITIIEKEAFKGLGLRSVEIPKNIKEIKDEAFKDNQLKLVKILGKGKEISENAFNEELVEEYGKCEEEFLYEFENTDEDELEIGEEIIGDAVGEGEAISPSYYFTFNGQVITGLTTEGVDNLYGQEIVFPPKNDVGEPILAIAPRAFQEKYFTGLDFSFCPTLQGIGAYAFSRTSIQSVNFDNLKNLKIIDKGAFEENQIEKIDLSDCHSLETIGDGAFYQNMISTLNLNNCNSLTSIRNSSFGVNEISYLDLSVLPILQSIGINAFSSNHLKSATIPLSLKSLNELAFSENPGLNSNKQVYLYTPTGENPNGLQDSNYHKINPELEIKPDSLFLYTFKDNVITGLSGMGKEYYSNNHHMILPGKNPQGENIIGIGQTAFSNINLQSVDFSKLNNLEYIDMFSFSENKLSKLDLSNNLKLKNISSYAFSDNVITDIKFATIERLGIKTFGRNLLKSITIPLSLKQVANDTFYGNPGSNDNHQVFLNTPDGTNPNNLENSSCHLINPITGPDDVSLYTFNGTTITGLSDKGRKYYTQNHDMVLPCKNPEGEYILSIKETAFSAGNMYSSEGSDASKISLNSVDFSKMIKLESIEEGAFYETPINKVIFGDTPNLKTIGQQAFMKTQIQKLDLSGASSLEKIGAFAFGFNNLNNLELSNLLKLSIIDVNAFAGGNITDLKLYNLPNLKVLKGFAGNSLTSLDLSNMKQLEEIGAFSFAENKISELDLSKLTNLKILSESSFIQNNIKTAKIPLSLKTIANNAFQNNLGNNDKKQVFVYTPTRKNPKGFLSNEWQIIDPIKITIKKVDVKGNPIEGVEFSVRYGPYENVSETPNSLKNSNELELNKISTDGLMVSDEKLDIVRVMDSGGGWSSGSGSGFIKPGDIKLKTTTDKNGTAEITIPYGPYYLVEDKTVPGYSANKKVTIIDETLDGKTITYTDYEVSIEIPETGTLGTIPYILLALILVGGAYVVLRKKKEEEK